MTTQPTQNPVPSESPSDLKFNAGKIDEFVTSLVNTYTDRFGTEHYTIEGLRQLAQEAIAAFGWVPVDSFQDGATLTLPNQVLRWKLPDGDGEYYRWDGALPKEVPADSTPEASVGVGAGAWVAVGDSSLRALLGSQGGDKHIGSSFGGSVYSDYAVSDIRRLSPGDTLQNKYEVVSPDGETFYMWSGDFPKKTNLSFNPQNEDGWVNVGSAKYKIGDIRNYPSDMQDNDKLTNALSTAEMVNIPSGYVLTLTGNYVAPSGSVGIYGGGEIKISGNFKVPENTYSTPVTLSNSYAAGITEIYLDGQNRIGQFVKIDNGYSSMIADAASATANTIDGVSLAKSYAAYGTQFVQVCEIIGHISSSNKSILGTPLVVNQRSGSSTFAFPVDSVKSFKIDGVTFRNTSGSVKNILIQGLIGSVVMNSKFYNCAVYNNYLCHNCRFINNEIHDLSGGSHYRYDTQSSNGIIASNRIYSLGAGDADILVYRQTCYTLVANNIITAPLTNTVYTSNHWAIAFHTSCHYNVASGNITTSKSGIGDLFFNADNLITGNIIDCSSLAISYCINNHYAANDITTRDWSTLEGLQNLVMKNNKWTVFLTNGVKMYGLNLKTIGNNKPFGYSGFVSIEYGTIKLIGNEIASPTKFGFTNPKTLMTSPSSAATDAVFPLGDGHLAGQHCFLHGLDAGVNSLVLEGNKFENFNYAMSWYVDSSTVPFCDMVIKNNKTVNCDVAYCLRGRMGNYYFRTGIIDNEFVSGVYGVINANAWGNSIERCHFGSGLSAAVLVAANQAGGLYTLLSVDNTFEGSSHTGFKHYDFNGYAYDTSVTLAKVIYHRCNMWFYQPSENLGTAQSYMYRVDGNYVSGASAGAVMRRTITEAYI
ncbi:MAG: hypothetical protein E6Z79_01155 [Haemophilus parainfluenzae]|nr:hypothetical protein [Haemophilus parainfluenzae]